MAEEITKDFKETENHPASNVHLEISSSYQSLPAGEALLDNSEHLSNLNEELDRSSNQTKDLAMQVEKTKKDVSQLYMDGKRASGDTGKNKIQKTKGANNNFDVKTQKASSNKMKLLPKDNFKMKIEKHRMLVMDHSLVVNGIKMSERKEKTEVTLLDIDNIEGNGKTIKIITIHTRSIGDRKYTRKMESGPNGEILDSRAITEMSDMEQEQFETDWNYYWIPTITNEEIELAENEAMMKKPSASVLLEESGIENVQLERYEEICSPEDCNVSGLLEPQASTQYESDSIIIEECNPEEGLLESFVRKHPLKVFYFGVTMMVLIILISQCCFLPEYPPCSWIKCILDCIEKANSGES